MSPATNSDGLDDATLRFVTVAFGVGLILLLLPMADGLGPAATGWAAIFLAVSPAMVFYSRYFIHEMLLVFFTLLTLAAGWRYAQSRRAGWAATDGRRDRFDVCNKGNVHPHPGGDGLCLGRHPILEWMARAAVGRRIDVSPAVGVAAGAASRCAGLAGGGRGVVGAIQFVFHERGRVD